MNDTIYLHLRIYPAHRTWHCAHGSGEAARCSCYTILRMDNLASAPARAKFGGRIWVSQFRMLVLRHLGCSENKEQMNSLISFTYLPGEWYMKLK